MRVRLTVTLVATLGAASLGIAGWAGVAGAVNTATPPPPLTKVSHDPYTGGPAQHATEAEPDTFAFGKTVVSVFQTGRYGDGGSVDTGWATSTDKGKTWTHGFLPGITVAEGGTWATGQRPGRRLRRQAPDVAWLPVWSDSSRRRAWSGCQRLDDGITWDDPVMAVGNDGKSYDKDWIACDNSPTSPHYGNCYVEVDVTSTGNRSSCPRRPTAGRRGVPRSPRPVLRPGSAVNRWSSRTARSWCPTRQTSRPNAPSARPTAATSWTASVLISNISDHEVPGMREEPLPSAEMNADGKIYVVWDDCRFRSGCTSNDIVMSTSDRWRDLVRGLPDPDRRRSAAARTTSTLGSGSHRPRQGIRRRIGLYYYFYPDASCSVSDCQLEVGYVSSTNGGTDVEQAHAPLPVR